jgi:hypothetical protein
VDTRQSVGAAQFELAERAWDAFRQPTPEALAALVGAAGRSEDRPLRTELPFLAPALDRFLQEYPWLGDGLSRTERRYLTLVAEGRADWPAVLRRMVEGEDVFYITDSALIELKDACLSSSPPLVAQENDVVTLTAAGRDVVEGRADRVALCGIDRWLGGVHLQGRTSTWRWDARRRTVVTDGSIR